MVVRYWPGGTPPLNPPALGWIPSPWTPPVAYRQFHEAVSRAQLAAWLPRGRKLLVDISGPRAESAEFAARAGHTVVRVLDAREVRRGAVPQVRARGVWGEASPQVRARGVWGEASPQVGKGHEPGLSRKAPGRLRTVVGDTSRLAFLPDGCVDGVIAGDRALSTHLVAESMVAQIARVLRPGGRVLASVDSLVLGMSVLADQHHWQHLADLPHAEVVLIPWADGTITRCYGPDQLRELFAGAGLTISWMRPLTVFSQSTVTHLLRRDPDSLPRLVSAEMRARADEATGSQLVVSAHKP